MDWSHEEWTLERLYELFEADQINLSPDYQRNPIWTVKAQRCLLDTILRPQPIPNFFVLRVEDGSFEMVDGQQRARTIIGFLKGEISSSAGVTYDDIASDRERAARVLNYPLNITVLQNLEANESIEMFYALVNSSGLRLNTPEIRRARYHETRFLALANELAGSAAFASLGLFGAGTVKRMNDVELVSEILALLKLGISEKKTAVDQLYEEDISSDDETAMRQTFNHVVSVLSRLNVRYPLSKTRYKQRADLYTLFEFVNAHASLSVDTFERYYDALLTIAPHVRPSQDRCDPLRDYARNCVSQSHSESARRERSAFFRQLLRNDTATPNPVQSQIIQFLELPDALIEMEGAWTIDCAPVHEEDL